MRIKKSLKKIFSNFVPKGFYKEKLKVFYYNALAKKSIKYNIVKKENGNFLYKTNYEELNFFTNVPLYSITPDFENYQYFYKIKADDIIIDGGANVGILALLFTSRTGSKGHVFCFEPDTINIEKLKYNFSLNAHLRNYSIHNELMWDKETTIDFQESGTVASSAIWFSGTNAIVKKKAISLDVWAKINKIQRLDFIKMDIEGAEIKTIEGCRAIIEQFNPNFAIASYHIVDGQPTYIKLEQFFKEIDYPYITKEFGGYEIITFAGPHIADYQNKQA